MLVFLVGFFFNFPPHAWSSMVSRSTKAKRQISVQTILLDAKYGVIVPIRFWIRFMPKWLMGLIKFINRLSNVVAINLSHCSSSNVEYTINLIAFMSEIHLNKSCLVNQLVYFMTAINNADFIADL